MKYLRYFLALCIFFIVSHTVVSAACPGATLYYTSSNTSSACGGSPQINGPWGFYQNVPGDTSGNLGPQSTIGQYTMTCGSASSNDSITSCSPWGATATCTTPWGATANQGDFVTAYQSTTGNPDCNSQTMRCVNHNGVGKFFDGFSTYGFTFTNQTCTPQTVGCMDTNAYDYNPSATVHDQTQCHYDCPTTSWSNCSLTGTNHGVGGGASCANGWGGTCSATCSNGTWTGLVDNCTPPPPTDCPAGPVSWGAGCTGTAPATSNGGYTSPDVTNTNPSYNGSATFSCSSGSFSYYMGTCTPTGVPVNGVCSSAPETCDQGAYSNSPSDTATDYQWTCLGTNGGVSSGTCRSPKACPLPWGGTIAEGGSVATFQASTGSPNCVSETRTCSNGTLSGSYQYQSCTPGVTPTNGACSATHYSCNAGNSISNNFNGSTYTWICQGLNGGFDSGTCSESAGGTPTNGACGTTTYWDCTAGTVINGDYTPSTYTYTWVCQGLNGGSNSNNCSYTIMCTDPGALNYGSPGSCINLCDDPEAPNYGSPGECLIPDLRVYTRHGHSSPSPITTTAGTVTTLSADIENIGAGGTGESFYNFIQVANASGGLGTLTDLPGVQMSALASNDTASMSQGYTFPSAGTYSMRACADKSNRNSSGTIYESNEGNNCGPWFDINVRSAATASITSDSCTISNTYSSCAVTVSWTSSNTLTPRSIKQDGISFSTLANDLVGTSRTVSYGTTTFAFYHNGGSLLDTSLSTATCTTGTRWTGTKCSTKWADIIAPDCAINNGFSSCHTTVSWTSNNTGRPSVRKDGTEFSTAPNNAGVDKVLQYGANVFTFRDSTGVLDTATATAYCAAGTAKIGESCINASDLVAGAITPIVAKTGVSVTLQARITNQGTASTGVGFSNFIQVASASNGGGTITGLSSTGMSTLGIGSFSNTSHSHTFSAAGTYSARACADKSNAGSLGVIDELNENNNCGPWTDITVTTDCTSQAVTWGGGSCSGTAGVTSSGSTTSVTDSTIPDTGSATFLCTNGTFTEQGGSTCTGAPVVTLTANPTTVASGNTSTLTWTVTGQASSCSIDQGIGSVSTSGGSTATSPLVASKTFTLTCTGPGGTGTDSITVNIGNFPDLTAGQVSPTTATAGTQKTFTARITNQGNASTGASFYNFIQIATGAGGTGSLTDQGRVQMATLASGAYASTSLNYNFPVAGTYSMRACADKSDRNDANGTINEGVTNEGNNCGGWTDIIVSSGSGSCPAGQYWNGSSCSTCPPNEYCTGGPIPPTPCPPLTYSPAGSDAVNDCTPMSGTLDANPSSCTVATGASTCNTILSWTTTNPIGTSAITRDGTAGNLYTGNNNAGQQTAVPYEVDGSVIYRLYNNVAELASTTVSVSCAAGATNWDTIGGVCADPQVGPVTVVGDYLVNPGSIDFSCVNSDHYSLIKNPGAGQTIIRNNLAYSGPVSVPVTDEANYQIICSHGSVDAFKTVMYHYPAPAATIFIDAYPKTVNPGGKSSVVWRVNFPTNACAISAKAVCANNICSSTQEAAASTINQILSSGTVDADTLGAVGANQSADTRTITAAVQNIAPGHTGTDYNAIGKKTFTFNSTIDFTIDCGNGKKASTRVRAASSNEQ